MARKFLSFLGTGCYEEGIYDFTKIEDGKYQTPFIQEALINTACKDWTAGDKAIIFLTDLARKVNWIKEGKEEEGLEAILEKNSHIEVKPLSIPDGKSEEEIWDIFEIIVDEIDEGDEIIFDITHGFRSLPMLALVVLNYIRVIKDAKILGIYYGAWEAKDDDLIPIFDLTPLEEMLEWSQAVNTFLKYGNSGNLKDLSNSILGPKLPSQQWARDTKALIEKLDDFTMGLYTCRGRAVRGRKASKKSIATASEEVEGRMAKVKEGEEIQVKPLLPLMDKIEENIRDFHGEDNLNNGLATIKWCIDNKLIQQAYTALDETVKTYICVRYDLDPTNNDHREKIAQSALKMRGLNKSEDEWQMETAYRNKIIEIARSLDEDLVKLSNRITDRRNDINHFGFRDAVTPSDDLVRDIRKYYDDFIGILDLDQE